MGYLMISHDISWYLFLSHKNWEDAPKNNHHFDDFEVPGAGIVGPPTSEAASSRQPWPAQNPMEGYHYLGVSINGGTPIAGCLFDGKSRNRWWLGV